MVFFTCVPHEACAVQREILTDPVLIISPNVILVNLLFPVLQEWDIKAAEAKRQYDKAKQEYKESGGGEAAAPAATSSSKK